MRSYFYLNNKPNRNKNPYRDKSELKQIQPAETEPNTGPHDGNAGHRRQLDVAAARGGSRYYMPDEESSNADSASDSAGPPLTATISRGGGVGHEEKVKHKYQKARRESEGKARGVVH